MSFLTTALVYGGFAAVPAVPFVFLSILVIELYGCGADASRSTILWSAFVSPLLMVGLFVVGIILRGVLFEGTGADIGLGIFVLLGIGGVPVTLVFSLFWAIYRTSLIMELQKLSFEDDMVIVFGSVVIVALTLLFVILLNIF